MDGELLRRACIDDCTAALAAVPGGSQDCGEASGAPHRARLLARRACAHLQLSELAAAAGDFAEASLDLRISFILRYLT